jgi:hydrogenase expression/formation protein HypD
MFELKDKALARDILSKLKKLDRKFRFMHVCGTHQDTLVKSGLEPLLLECNIEIGQGPGCPVCVTTPKEIEQMILLAQKGKIVSSFGDMMRVPGEKYSLQSMKTEGCDVRTVYSIEDAVDLARQKPNQEVVFMAVGFETTAPTTASVLLSDPPTNFSVLSCHRLIPPALQALLTMGEINIDGFIDPGHVSTIIGEKPYDFISKTYRIPQVIAGFEPLDLLMGVWMLVKQIQQKKAFVENEYVRAVHETGNVKAQQVISEVFVSADVKWRGFPVISQSGLVLKKKFEIHDARRKFEDELLPLEDREFKEPKGCRCGEVLRGVISSKDCPLFGSVCTPNHPVGPCMVSVEGSCHIEYLYGK